MMRISVAMTVCDAGGHLAPQLASLECQDRLPDEVVVVDDASRDGSAERVAHWARTAPFPVELTNHPRRTGSNRAFAAAIAGCTGDVVALCDHDDVWRPDKLARIAKAFTAHPEAGVVFSDGDLLDERGEILGGTGVWASFGLDPGVPSGPAGRFRSLTLAPRVPGCTLAFARRHADLALPFPDALYEVGQPLRHDAWLVSMLEAAAPSLALADRLLGYRIHPGQQVGLAGVRGSGAATALRRGAGRSRAVLADQLSARVAALEPVCDRLADQAGSPRARACLEVASEAMDHLRARHRLASGGDRRLAAVLREHRAGRYGAYSTGTRSALADLLRR